MRINWGGGIHTFIKYFYGHQKARVSPCHKQMKKDEEVQVKVKKLLKPKELEIVRKTLVLPPLFKNEALLCCKIITK